MLRTYLLLLPALGLLLCCGKIKEPTGNKTEPSVSPNSIAADNPYEKVDIAHFMEGIDGTFVFLDVAKDIRLVYNDKRANTRFSPCSTFKIPNTLIALETGFANGPDMTIKWDPIAYPKEEWWDTMLKPFGFDWARDHTLRSAFQNSCVWFYKELAKKTGAEKMQAYLDKFDYGNRDISGGIDSFWLESSLQISAVEQVDFLKHLVKNGPGLSEKTRHDGFSIFEKERRESRVLYAKTGGGKDIGWFVGIVENGGKQYIFALNMAGSFQETGAKRVDISLEILKALGVW